MTAATYSFGTTGATLVTALTSATAFNVVFFSTLLTSITAYRLSPWHPLAHFPGPYGAAISKWWLVRCILLKGGRHLELQRCHQQYGPWLRVGPNELSVNDPAAIMPIYTKLSRAPAKADTMITVVDRDRHLQRRRVWTKALSGDALEMYGLYAQKRLAQMFHHMDQERSKGIEAIDVDRWINLFFMDLAGDIGFSGGFETMLAGEDKEGWMEMASFVSLSCYGTHVALQLGMGVRFVSAMGQVPWMRDIFALLPQPGPLETFQSFVKAKVQQIRGEQESKSKRADIMGALLDEDAGAVHLSTDEAVADAGLIIVGATDTSVQTVLTALRFLSTDAYRLRKLQREVDSVFGWEHGDDISANVPELAKLPYLNACVNESFRVFPPGPAGPPRTTGSEGAEILGRWIPPHTTVHVPVYTMHRDRANFGPRADQYIPERWLSDEEQARMIADIGKDSHLTAADLKPCNSQAFMPFSAGYGNCVGRALGLQNVKLTLATLVHHYTISHECGFDPHKYDASFREYGLWTHDRLRLTLGPR
ncbi:cytochrome P450 [Schizophyllum commune]